jgi:hypothetical protein
MLSGAAPAGGGLLDQIVASLTAMPADQLKELQETTLKATAHMRWIPNPGPQTDAYFSEADVLLYGGEPGGGKSQLILGLAFNEHRRSLIMRREYGDLERLIDDALKIHGSRDGFNGSPPPKLKISADKVINFRAAHRIGDEQGTMGQGRDLLGIDEATHFAESQIRFLMGWVRSEVPGQRCRTVLATNPPLSAEGLWVNKMFAPWLDPKYPHPAKPGELRWVVSDEDGNDEWVSGPGDTRIVRGKTVRPVSRTYIPASVRDNPYYAATDYERTLDNLPEPYRSQLMGGFQTEFKDDEWQVIKTPHVKAAQSRWRTNPPEGVPMCAMGVDASGGGTDPMVIAIRHDGWYAPIHEFPGKSLPQDRLGTHCAGLVVSRRRDDATVIVDMGGGYGGGIFEHLKANSVKAEAYKGAATSSHRTRDRQMTFVNKRSEAYWRFREALDPDQPGGSPIALPDDQVLLADLTAPTWEAVRQGGTMAVKVESKEDVCARLGRSTDRGDAVVMAWAGGLKQANVAGGFTAPGGRKTRPQVQMNHQGARRLAGRA